MDTPFSSVTYFVPLLSPNSNPATSMANVFVRQSNNSNRKEQMSVVLMANNC